jgi:hypothetical protein
MARRTAWDARRALRCAASRLAPRTGARRRGRRPSPPRRCRGARCAQCFPTALLLDDFARARQHVRRWSYLCESCNAGVFEPVKFRSSGAAKAAARPGSAGASSSAGGGGGGSAGAGGGGGGTERDAQKQRPPPAAAAKPAARRAVLEDKSSSDMDSDSAPLAQRMRGARGGGSRAGAAAGGPAGGPLGAGSCPVPDASQAAVHGSADVRSHRHPTPQTTRS